MSTQPTDPARADALRHLAATESDETLASWVAFVGTADDARTTFNAELARRRLVATRAALAADLERAATALESMLTTWIDFEHETDGTVPLADDEYPFHRSLDDLVAEVWGAVRLIRDRDDAAAEPELADAAAPPPPAAPQDWRVCATEGEHVASTRHTRNECLHERGEVIGE